MYFGTDGFVFTGSNLRERDSVSSLFSRKTVKINGKRKFACQSATKLFGASDAIFNVDALSCSSIQVTIGLLKNWFLPREGQFQLTWTGIKGQTSRAPIRGCSPVIVVKNRPSDI